jgi:hypothetical protein
VKREITLHSEDSSGFTLPELRRVFGSEYEKAVGDGWTVVSYRVFISAFGGQVKRITLIAEPTSGVGKPTV